MRVGAQDDLLPEGNFNKEKKKLSEGIIALKKERVDA